MPRHQGRHGQGPHPAHKDGTVEAPGNDDIIVSCKVELDKGLVEISSRSDAGAHRQGGEVVATGGISVVTSSPLAGGPKMKSSSSLDMGSIEPSHERQRMTHKVAIVMGLTMFAATGSSVLPGARMAVQESIKREENEPRTASQIPSIGELCGIPTGGWSSDGFCSFPGHLDSALHLGVAAPGSGAKVPVAAGCYMVGAGGSSPQSFAAGGTDGGGLWAVMDPTEDPSGPPSGQPQGVGGGKRGRSSRSSFLMVSGAGGRERRSVLKDLETIAMTPKAQATKASPGVISRELPSLMSELDDQAEYEMQWVASEPNPAIDEEAMPALMAAAPMAVPQLAVSEGRPRHRRPSTVAASAAVLQLLRTGPFTNHDGVSGSGLIVSETRSQTPSGRVTRSDTHTLLYFFTYSPSMPVFHCLPSCLSHTDRSGLPHGSPPYGRLRDPILRLVPGRNRQSTTISHSRNHGQCKCSQYPKTSDEAVVPKVGRGIAT